MKYFLNLFLLICLSGFACAEDQNYEKLVNQYRMALDQSDKMSLESLFDENVTFYHSLSNKRIAGSKQLLDYLLSNSNRKSSFDDYSKEYIDRFSVPGKFFELYKATYKANFETEIASSSSYVIAEFSIEGNKIKSIKYYVNKEMLINNIKYFKR